MKNWIAAAMCLAFAASPLTFAQDKAKAEDKKGQQQARMKECNEKAGKKDLKGDDRKKYMSACLKGEDPDKKVTQQDRMAACNKEAGAKNLKGEERKTFMSGCLKG